MFLHLGNVEEVGQVGSKELGKPLGFDLGVNLCVLPAVLLDLQHNFSNVGGNKGDLYIM